MVKIVLVGVGGFARNYVGALLNSDYEWVGAVDPFFNFSTLKDEILKAGIPVFNTLEEFYAQGSADLAIIATPTYLHASQTITSLEHGSNVLCEKPAAVLPSDVERMIAAAEKANRFVGVGFQWSYSPAMLALKRDILSGLLGKPKYLKVFISWPRGFSYYSRGGGWGGKISLNGQMVLDSIVSNACAHYVFNMMFLLGDRIDTAADIKSIEANCLRANNIENFDTCVMRLTTEGGAKLFYAASHATDRIVNPIFEYSFENAVVSYDFDNGGTIKAVFNDGSQKIYGNPNADNMVKLHDCVNAVETGIAPVCTAATALPHTRLVEALYKTVPIVDFPKERIKLVEHEDFNGVCVPGLYEEMRSCWDDMRLMY